MRPDAALADRHRAVRVAAKAWRGAGAIDDAAFRAIVAAYPDDRVRLGLGLRILAGLAVWVGGGAAAALLGMMVGLVGDSTVFLLVFAVVFIVATEIQIGRLRRAQAGAEYATALLAATFAAAAWISLVDIESRFVAGAGLAVLFAMAAWRWGYALLAGVAAGCLLIAMTWGHAGRGLWLASGLAALPVMLGAGASIRLPPAQRRCVLAAGLVLLAGAYVAMNVYALDHRWVEEIEGHWDGAPWVWTRGAAILATIVVPPLVLFLAVRRRARALLTAGSMLAAASLLTLRAYHPVGPWWLVLVAAGAGCLALAIALRRWLAAGPGRERSGFTADPTLEHRRLATAAELAVTLAAMSPGSNAATERSFEGGGGRSGGGGATGQA